MSETEVQRNLTAFLMALVIFVGMLLIEGICAFTLNLLPIKPWWRTFYYGLSVYVVSVLAVLAFLASVVLLIRYLKSRKRTEKYI
jgi:ABC-type xylose transport system permease subunit